MKDVIKMMESNMSPEAVRRAHIKAEQEIMSIRLAQLCEEMNIKQSEMENFTQSSVSKIKKSTVKSVAKLNKGSQRFNLLLYGPPLLETLI